MAKKNIEWEEIDTNVDADTAEEEFKLNLEDNEGGKQKTEDTRRALITVSKESTRENKEDKNNKARAEDEEDQEERTVQGKQTRETELDADDDSSGGRKPNRAHKRIQTLLARERQKDYVINQVAQENAALKARLRETERKSTGALRDQYKQALEDTESQLEQATNANDAAKIAKLTRQMADLTMKYNAYEAVSEDLEDTNDQNTQQNQQVRQVQQPVEVPDEAKSWLKRNPWFFQDEVKHVAARKISRELTEEGELDPSDPDYWQELDKRMGETFGKPVKSQNKREETDDQSEEPIKQRKKGSPFGSRSDEDSAGEYSFANDKQFSRNGNRVTANPTQEDYEMAEKFGLKIQDLMKEKFKYAQQGYKGYVTIDIPGQS